MYLILSDGKIYDYDLALSEETAEFLDKRASDLRSNWPEHFDPSDYWLKLDNLLALGFIACQLYMTTSITEANLAKQAALDSGPIHSCGITYARLIHEAANVCKHFEEWPTDLTLKGKHRRSVEALQLLLSSSDDFSAPLILEHITKPHSPTLANLIPILKSWRVSLDERA